MKPKDTTGNTSSFRTSSPYENLFGYARAVRRGSRIAVSGTAPIDKDGETIESDAYEQAKRCFEIILEAVDGLGGSRADVIRIRVYITDALDWEAVGRAYGECFQDTYPSATLIVVRGFLDPRWLVMIEADAEVLH